MEESQRNLDAKLRRRFREIKPNATESSIRVYAAGMRRLYKISADLNYHDIANYVRLMSATKARSILTPLIVFEGRERFGRLYDGVIKEAQQQEGSQRFSEAELANWTNSRAINAGITRSKFDVDRLNLLKPRKLPVSYFRKLVQYVTLKIYKEFHWRSDLPTVLLGHNAGKNHYVNNMFYFSKFKTAKAFARKNMLPLTFKPSNSLSSLLKKYIAVRDAQGFDNKYMIVNKKGKPFTSSSFNQFMSDTTFKYVGKRLGTSQLRKIYVTEHLLSNPTLWQKRQMARDMMQTKLETHEGYARFHK